MDKVCCTFKTPIMPEITNGRGIHNATADCASYTLTDGDGSTFDCRDCLVHHPDQLIPSDSGGINCTGYNGRYHSATLTSILPMRTEVVQHILERKKAPCVREP